jgi:uncharacterized membrane protein
MQPFAILMWNFCGFFPLRYLFYDSLFILVNICNYSLFIRAASACLFGALKD